MAWREEVKEHYKKQAEVYHDSKQSTMADVFIRDKEVDELIKNIQKINTLFSESPNILEVGCGNGYLAQELIKKIQNKITAIDFSEELLNVARIRNLNNIQFILGDATKLDFNDNSFDIVITERCLINLESWEQQKEALEEIHRVLRPGGYFIMIEAFTDGWRNTNEARNVVGLSPIPQPHHNVFFKKDIFHNFIQSIFDFAELGQKENFLSTYYFGSRVLYPAMINQKKELVYNNKFNEFFSHLPEAGNYASIQQFILKKKV